MRVLIDGDIVTLEPVLDDLGELAGFYLIGPKLYEGHYHGALNERYSYCIPSVVASIAEVSEESCPDRPNEVDWGDKGYIVSVWKTDALL